MTIKVLFELRVFHRIMSKVEPFTLMYDSSHPLAKVSIADFASPLGVFISDEFPKIIEINLF